MKKEKKSFVPSKNKFVPSQKVTKNVVPGTFPTYEDGRLIKLPGVMNIAIASDSKAMSHETLFKKTPEEKKRLKALMANFKMLMIIQYGDNWRALKGAAKVGNPSVRVNKLNGNFELI